MRSHVIRMCLSYFWWKLLRGHLKLITLAVRRAACMGRPSIGRFLDCAHQARSQVLSSPGRAWEWGCALTSLDLVKPECAFLAQSFLAALLVGGCVTFQISQFTTEARQLVLPDAKVREGAGLRQLCTSLFDFICFRGFVVSFEIFQHLHWLSFKETSNVLQRCGRKVRKQLKTKGGGRARNTAKELFKRNFRT